MHLQNQKKKKEVLNIYCILFFKHLSFEIKIHTQSLCLVAGTHRSTLHKSL